MDILKLHGFYTTNGKLILLMLDWINQEITLKIMSIYLDKSTGYHKLDYTTTLLITIRTAESPGELSFLQGGGCYMIPFIM